MNDFWPEMVKSERQINFYIIMDNLSKASTLSEGLALYDFAKPGVG